MINLSQAIRKFQSKDRELTDGYLPKIFHPGFWSTRLIRQAVERAVPYAQGDLLDAGCGLKPYEASFRGQVSWHCGMDYSAESGYRGNRADIYGDLAHLPFVSESFSTILCTEVLEHVPNPQQVVTECFRILRPNGVVLCTAPFVYPIHDEHDYFRYSPKGLRSLFESQGFDIVTVRPLGGTATTLALLINIYLHDICFIWNKWLYPLGLIIRPIIWLVVAMINTLGGLVHWVLPSTHLSFNHFLVARKK